MNYNIKFFPLRRSKCDVSRNKLLFPVIIPYDTNFIDMCLLHVKFTDLFVSAILEVWKMNYSTLFFLFHFEGQNVTFVETKSKLSIFSFSTMNGKNFNRFASRFRERNERGSSSFVYVMKKVQSTPLLKALLPTPS